ncbi:hypothetical protein N9K77_01785 [bacterium]|nr:hypothetical protein [bacterium]
MLWVLEWQEYVRPRVQIANENKKFNKNEIKSYRTHFFKILVLVDGIHPFDIGTLLDQLGIAFSISSFAKATFFVNSCIMVFIISISQTTLSISLDS